MLGQAVLGIRFVVKDGSHHSVDSSDLAFKICAANALRDGKNLFVSYTNESNTTSTSSHVTRYILNFTLSNFIVAAIRKSSPVILEPIMNIEIQAPLEFQVTTLLFFSFSSFFVLCSSLMIW